MFSKWLYGICYCLLVVAGASIALGQGLSVNSIPNSGLVQPITPEMTGSAGAMSAACPPGQALTQITSTTFTCLPFEGGTGSIPPGTNSQLLGYDNNNNPENQTVSGGNGNCLYTRTNLNAGSITCGNYVTFGGGTFTGTVAAPLFYMNSASGGLYSVAGSGISAGGAITRPNSVAIPSGGQFLIGDAPLNFSNLAGQVTDSQLVNAYSGVGACPAGDVVIGLNRNAAPMCNTISGSGGAPLVNPAGGQNNYAPINAPSFTGNVNIQSTTGAGNIYWPSATVPAVGSITTAGAAANFLGLLAGAHYDGSNWLGDSNAPTAIVENGQIGFYGGTSSIGAIWSPVMLGYFNNSGLTMGTNTSITTPGLQVNGNAGITGITTAGTISATQLNTVGANVTNNLTVQNSGTFGSIGVGTAAPTPGTGAMIQATGNGNYSTTMTLTNQTPGANSYATYYSGNDAGHFAAFQLGSSTATTSGYPSDSLSINTNGANGMMIATGATTAPINFQLGYGNNVGAFRLGGLWAASLGLGQVNPADPSTNPGSLINGAYSINGTTGGAFGNASNGNQANTTLYLQNDLAHYAAYQLTSSGFTAAGPIANADEFVLGTNAANGIAYNSATNGWHNFWVNSNRVFYITNATVATNHLAADPYQPGPVFTGCAPMAGSRDMAGYCLAQGWPVIITFGKPWAGTPACVVTGAGGSLDIFGTTNQSTNAIQINCQTPAGGACGAVWFNYICIALNP